jgi:histone H3/H4
VFQIVPAVDKSTSKYFKKIIKETNKQTNKQGRKKFKAEDLNTVHTVQVFHLSN